MKATRSDGLIGHWPFAGDGEDRTGAGHHAVNTQVDFQASGPGGEPSTAAGFNGIDSGLEVPDHPGLRLGTGDFSIAVRLHTEERRGDVVGDIVSKFDPGTRCGFSLGVVTNGGVTTTAQSNYRQVHFGMDQGQLDPDWTDCGRPGRAVFVQALAVSKGDLYAGTFEQGVDETGHLWRYDEDQQWIDCGGTPDGSNGVPSVAEFDGDLYCCSGRYNPNGSCLGDAQNAAPGGRVYRVAGDGAWVDCGHPGAEDAVAEDHPPRTDHSETGKADEAMSLTVYRGALYATSNHRRGVFRYEGNRSWKHIGLDCRIMTFSIYQDRLYALVNGGPVYRYEADSEWAYCGTPEGSTQTYSGVTCAGDLYVGTWPQADVFRYAGGESWDRIGRTGYEREVMAMVLYNAKVYAGSLPMANVWRMDAEGMTFVGNLDNTPQAYLRRVWSMAVCRGRLFGGTLPSGRVMSIQAGRMATHDHALAPGWRHLAAVRQGNHLRLHVDGKLVARSAEFRPADYDLTNARPLKIGFGVGHHFRGSMSDLRLYARALKDEEVKALVSAT